MPWQWLERRSGEGEDWTGFLEQGVRLRGDLFATGTFRVNATVAGRLSSDGVLILGEQAEVDGELEARIVMIGGKFKGTVRATDRVEVQATGIVNGDVFAPCMVIAAGAIFQGRCHMVSDPPAEQIVTIPIRSPAQTSS
ncbi:MAG: polymer-forming cytoskeletal protein [Candidatus Acidiferrales bacterium]